jgi:hypothetical protein
MHTMHTMHSSSSLLLLLPLLALLLLLPAPAAAVDRSKFRTCGNTGFCKRYRKREPSSHFHVDVVSLCQCRYFSMLMSFDVLRCSSMFFDVFSRIVPPLVSRGPCLLLVE